MFPKVREWPIYKKVLNIVNYQTNANKKHSITSYLLGWLLAKRREISTD